MENTADPKIDLLIENILAQARYFLENADEFYPFGTIIDKDLKLRPVSYYSGDEYPDSEDHFNDLEAAIQEGIKNKDYSIAAIGRDVYLNLKSQYNNAERRTALQIFFYTADQIRSDLFLYQKKGDAYFFEKY